MEKEGNRKKAVGIAAEGLEGRSGVGGDRVAGAGRYCEEAAGARVGLSGPPPEASSDLGGVAAAVHETTWCAVEGC